MAEVAGTAIGVISLGIQVCQGLVSYYQAYRGQDEKVRDILCDVRALSNTLEAAHACLAKANSARLVAISQAEDSIVACAVAIDRLEQLLKRCRQTISPTATASEHIQLAFRKAAFPFRQSTIRDFSETVKGLQANVSLAIQTLQLEASGHLLNDTSEVLLQAVTNNDNISRISHELNHLSDRLGNSHLIMKDVASDTSAMGQSLRQELPLISRNASQVASEMGRLRISISSVDQQMTMLGTEVNDSLASLDQKLDSLPGAFEHRILALMDSYYAQRYYSDAKSSNSLAHIAKQESRMQMELLQKPNLLRCVGDIIRTERQEAGKGYPTNNDFSRNNHAAVVSRDAIMPLCSCKIGKSHQSRTWSTEVLDLTRATSVSHIHKMGCPLSTQRRSATVLAAKYSYRSRFVTRLLSFSVSITSGAGGLSISPSLTFRATVSDSSPAFSLFTDDSIVAFKGKSAESYCEWVTRELYRLFREHKAYPTDVNVWGDNLLHVALTEELTLPRDDSYGRLIRALKSWGVEENHANLAGRNPLDLLVQQGGLFIHEKELVDMSLELLHQGLQFSESWWPTRGHRIDRYWTEYTRNAALCLHEYRCQEEVVNDMQCGPLCRAILFKSEKQVAEILDHSPVSLCEKTLLGQNPLHLAANWPAGIKILLSAGGCQLLDQRDDAGVVPVVYATHAECLEAVRLFVEADCAFYTAHSFQLDIVRDVLRLSSTEIAKYLAEALAGRRKRLAAMALHHLPCEAIQLLELSPETVLDADAWLVTKLLAKQNIPVPSSLRVPDDWDTIYHRLFRWGFSWSMPLREYADLFYNAGFHDVHRTDDQKKSLLMMNLPGLPLSVNSVSDAAGFYLWLISKGLRLDHKSLRITEQGEQVPHSPAALYVSKAITEAIRVRWKYDYWWSNRMWLDNPWPERLEEKEARILLTTLVDETVSDDCICACSPHGCSALTAMLKEAERLAPEADMSSGKHFVKCLVQSLDGARTDAWEGLTADVVRFMTSRKLLLTHTCCTWKNGDPFGDFVIFNDEDRDDIREEDSDDLNMLESLMEEFEQAFRELKIPLLKFIDEYWEPTMSEVMQPGGVDEDSEAKIAELGVVLQPTASPKPVATLPTIRRFKPRRDKELSIPPDDAPASCHKHRRRHSF